MNKRMFKNNAFDDSAENLTPVIKTIFLNTDSSASLKNSMIGIAMLFFCILAGTVGVVLCFADSFSLEMTFGQIFMQSFLILIIFTAIYLLPSMLFTTASFFGGAGLLGLYIYMNFENIYNSLYYTLNLCLYRIANEGYIIGNIVDYGLARESNPNAEKFIGTSIFLITIIIVCVFSYIVYSKKSMWIALLFSLVVIFPGFFYGFIPSYFSFSIIVAFWVSVFAVNIFETGYIENFIHRSNKIPEKKFEKYKYRVFKKQYYRNINALKSEIKEIVKSPNREDNSLRLNRLVRELQQISNSQDWFLRFYGLNKLYKPKTKNISENTNAEIINGKKNKKPPKAKKEEFMSPLKLEKLKIKEEKRILKEKEIAEYEAHKKELRSLSIGKRFKLHLKNNFLTKIERSTRSGYVGFFAFTIALAAIILVQPFISPKAKFKTSIPQSIMENLTNTVEFLLVGSNSRVYGGYSGGMGGGFLLNPNGANFKYKPILKLKPATTSDFRSDSSSYYFPMNTFESGVVYLKNWYGNEYNGQRWFEADKTHVDEYESLKNDFGIAFEGRYDESLESLYGPIFTSLMQDVFAASMERRNSELKTDTMVIEHLVSGGRASFIPYFTYNAAPSSSNFALQKTADLSTSLSRPLNSMFRYPEYAVMFYSVDNVLNRSEIAIEDLKQYIDYYENQYPQDLETVNREYEEELEKVKEEKRIINEICYAYGLTDKDISWIPNGELPQLYIDIDVATNAIPPELLDEFREEVLTAWYEINNQRYQRYLTSSFLFSFSSFAVPPQIASQLPLQLDFNNIKGLEPFYNAESAYYDFVMEHYLDVYDSFPKEVSDLALEIVQDANAVSNFEMALAIEKYLAENHDYTLQPIMPDDPKKDFVYNFLFQTKEGYCTYYATSMVMMMRSLGIPSRYVEGYLVDMRRVQKDENDNQFITVYDSNGHAWPEVYIRGIGWIPFEPTTPLIETPAETEPYVYTPPARIPGYDMMGEMTSAYEEDYDDDFTIADLMLANNSGSYFSLLILLAVLLTVLVLNLINYIIKLQRTKYFKTAKSKDAVVKMFAYTLKFLKHCGFVMHNDEGLNTFAERVSSNLEIFDGVGFIRTAEIMQRARYSKHEMSEKDRAYVYDFINAMNKNAKKQLKPNLRLKFKYVYFIL